MQSGSGIDLGMGGDLCAGFWPEVLGFWTSPGIVMFVSNAAGRWTRALGVAARWGAKRADSVGDRLSLPSAGFNGESVLGQQHSGNGFAFPSGGLSGASVHCYVWGSSGVGSGI